MSLDEHEHGPITEYHGTIDLPKVISEGIRGGNPKTRSKHYVPEGLREEDLVSYTHPDREMALAFAQDRAKRLKLDRIKSVLWVLEALIYLKRLSMKSLKVVYLGEPIVSSDPVVSHPNT